MLYSMYMYSGGDIQTIHAWEKEIGRPWELGSQPLEI
jgi:hypothetical protein